METLFIFLTQHNITSLVLEAALHLKTVKQSALLITKATAIVYKTQKAIIAQ